MPFLAPSANTSNTGQQFNTVASTLVRLHEDVSRDELTNGSYMSVRTISTNDIPTFSASSTAPSADTDVATNYISLLGRSSIISGPSEITLSSEISNLSNWISGFNQGLRVRWDSNMYRLSTEGYSYVGDTSNGSQDNNLSPAFKLDNMGVYSDIILEGDVLFITGTNSSRFAIWVKDRLVTTSVTAAGTGLSVDASGQIYTMTGTGRQYFKIKFPTVDTRSIRIFHYGAGGIGDFYTRSTSTVYPRYKKKLNWLHLADTYGTANGPATNAAQTAAYTMANQFGPSINFINASHAGCGFAKNASASDPNWLERWDIDLKLNKAPDIFTIFGSYADGGLSNTASNVTSLVTKAKTLWPNCEIVVLNTVTPTQVAGNTDISSETLILNAASAAGATVIPVQSDPQGKWLTGSGSISSPANNGNADLYAAGSSPSPAGHSYWGRRWARGIYTAMRNKLGS